MALPQPSVGHLEVKGQGGSTHDLGMDMVITIIRPLPSGAEDEDYGIEDLVDTAGISHTPCDVPFRNRAQFFVPPTPPGLRQAGS